MAEIKRILSDSRRRLLLILLLLMGLGGYGLGLFGGWLGNGTEALKEEAAQYRDLLKVIKTMPLSEAGPYLEGRDAPAALELKKTVEHLLDYPDYMEFVQQQAVRMSQSQLAGGNPNSFAYRNIQKTAADFARIRDVEVRLGSQKAVSVWIMQRLPELFSAMGILLIVLSFFDEKKTGLRELIRSCPGGRSILTIRRLEALLCFSALFTFLFSALPLGISFLVYGGWEDLSCPVQSIPLFGTCLLRVSIGGWIALYFLVRILCGFTLGVLLWFILSFLKNWQFSWLLLALLFAGEYMAYTHIAPQMRFSFLRYINIFACIYPDEMFRTYVNINCFGRSVGTLTLMLWLMGLLLFILGPALVLLEGKRHAANARTGLKKLLEWFDQMLDKLRGRLGLLAAEGYKQLMINGGLLFLLAGLWVCAQLGVAYRSYPGNDAERMLDQYLESMQGPVTEASREEMEQIREALAGAAGSSAEEAFILLEQQLQRAWERAQAGSYEAWLVNERLVKTYLDKDMSSIQRWLSIVPSFFILLLCAPLFSYENQSGTRALLRGSVRGRQGIFLRKYLLGCGTALLFLGLISVRTYLAYRAYLGPQMMAVPIGNIPLLQGGPAGLSLNAFYGLLMLQRLLMGCVLACLVLWLSARMRDWLSVAAAACAILILPGLLPFFGIEWTASFSLFPHISGIEWIDNQKGMQNVLNAGIWLALGALSVWDNYRRWRKA